MEKGIGGLIMKHLTIEQLDKLKTLWPRHERVPSHIYQHRLRTLRLPIKQARLRRTWTVKEIRALEPCREKWREFKNAIGAKKHVTALQIAKASGPHGLAWLLTASGDPVMELRFWLMATIVSSSDSAHSPIGRFYNCATDKEWWDEHAKGMALVRKIYGRKRRGCA